MTGSTDGELLQRAMVEVQSKAARIEELEAERQAVIDAVNVYGDEVLHNALDAIGFAPRAQE